MWRVIAAIDILWHGLQACRVEVWTTANGVVQGDILDQRSTLSSRWRGAATVALL